MNLKEALDFVKKTDHNLASEVCKAFDDYATKKINYRQLGEVLIPIYVNYPHEVFNEFADIFQALNGCDLKCCYIKQNRG